MESKKDDLRDEDIIHPVDFPNVMSASSRNKCVESFAYINANYNIQNNRSRNIMTKYEKTNVIGFRLEQISFGAKTMLSKDIEEKCSSIREIVEMELKMHLLPFLICRTLNNKKEYWKLKDLIILE
jgi:DNA-directed RNA polymerase subunit K/omega